MFIGFVLLASSILGMLLGLLGLASSLRSANDPQESLRVQAEVRSKMQQEGVP